MINSEKITLGLVCTCILGPFAPQAAGIIGGMLFTALWFTMQIEKNNKGG